MADEDTPIIELKDVQKQFGSVLALRGVDFNVHAGEVHCLLGDNGAGKSTLIKTMAGVHQPTRGQLYIRGEPVTFQSPADSLDAGIGTVYQHLGLLPLMSVTRNFFLGREPTKGRGVFKRIDFEKADRIAHEEMQKMGIDMRDPGQAVGTMSGGEKQCLAISRAIYFGASVLILDEPTSALGVSQASKVLRYIAYSRAHGIGVIFITHNVYHAYPVGDRFTLLQRGASLGTYSKSQVSRDDLVNMMAGGKELADLEEDLAKAEEIAKQRKGEAAEA